jgi:hypothetical protein
MKTTLLAGAIIGLLATSSWASANLNLSKSNVNLEFPSGTIVTASTDVSGAAAHTVLRTPPGRDFILTQLCGGPGGILLQVDGVSIAQVGPGLCQTFTPGAILSEDQVVSCATLATETPTLAAETNNFCTIMGILEPPTAVATPTPPLP